MRRIAITAALLVGAVAQAATYDVENARKINKRCALCHGFYGQGTAGVLSPRLGGQTAKYLAKETAYYRDGVRHYPPMTLSSGIKRMTDDDIHDISEYLAAINLEEMDLPAIPTFKEGDWKRGKKAFKEEDCKTCHRKDGTGKPKKNIPMISGQYGSYLFNQMKKFKAKKRYHDDDPEDDTFDEISEAKMKDLVAYLTHITKERAARRHTAIAKLKQKFAPKKNLGMGGVAAMLGMEGMEKQLGENKSMVCDNCASTPGGYAGSFKITATGEILLSPAHKDLRLKAGTRGVFRITDSGAMEFIPEPAR